MTIEATKVQWEIEHGKTTNDVPTFIDLQPYFAESGRNFPVCPEGGHYIIGKFDERPKCSIGGLHSLPPD
jgi:hypothetical protein